MNTVRRQARIAGLWYFAASAIGVAGLVILPNKLIVDGDATATAAHLRTLESLARLGIASNLASQAMFIFVVVALYRLFLGVDRHQARMLLILGALVSVPVAFLTELCAVAALYLAKGGTYLAVFDPKQLDALSYLFVRLHGAGLRVDSIFWGLWLFPFGLLVIRSGFIPRPLGWLLFLAGASYVADTTTWLLFPQSIDAVGQVASILRSGELPIIFWLLIWGARGPRALESIAVAA